ncbi:MAG TPA: hypothetical protein V6C97_24395 [Oculatellaceae cyanobacterium]
MLLIAGGSPKTQSGPKMQDVSMPALFEGIIYGVSGWLVLCRMHFDVVY